MIESDYIARIAVLEAENAELRLQVFRIPLLESENKALREQVLLLSQKLSDLANKVEQMSVRKDSNNSSLPPSGDFGRKTRSLRTASGLKPGGQPGHKGTTLEMTDSPDHIEPLVPFFCGICAKALDVSRAQLVERRQVVDIPPIKAETTEYRSFGIACGCGHHQVAPFPEGVDNHIQYGPNIAALTVYHNVYQYIPFKRLQDFFTHICHLPLSVGTLENIVARMGDKARPVWDSFRKTLEQSKTVGGDETGAKVNGKKQWIWVWQSTFVTFIAISASRGSTLINALFPNGFPLATLCSDRWKAQTKTFAKGHPQTLEVENQLDALLAQTIPEQNARKTASLQKSMAKYRLFIFPFLYDPLIPYDNNASERSIRNVKVKLKVSGQFKTGQEHYCILRSIIDTTIKNGQSVFHAVAAIAHMPAPTKAAV